MAIDRAARDTIALRLAWRDCATSEIALPITVGSVAELSRSSEMEAAIIERVRAGESDETIAAAERAWEPFAPARHGVAGDGSGHPVTAGILRERRQSHPRRIPSLGVLSLAARLGVTPHRIYDRIYNGTVAIEPDARTGLYVFPHSPETLRAFQKLKASKLDRLSPVPRLAC